MRKVLVNRIPVWCIAVLAVVLISGTVAFGGDGKAQRGVLENEVLLAYASTSGNGGNSGRIWSAEGKVEGLGKVVVLVSASWNWSLV